MDIVAGVSEECGSASVAWCVCNCRRRNGVVLERANGPLRSRCRTDCRCLRRMGHRQQPYLQAVVGRSGRHDDNQGIGRRRRQRESGAAQWLCAPICRSNRRCRSGRLFRRRGEFGSFRAGAAASGNRADGRLFFTGTFHRRCCRARSAP